MLFYNTPFGMAQITAPELELITSFVGDVRELHSSAEFPFSDIYRSWLIPAFEQMALKLFPNQNLEAAILYRLGDKVSYFLQLLKEDRENNFVSDNDRQVKFNETTHIWAVHLLHLSALGQAIIIY